jgi:hypothetical protein
MRKFAHPLRRRRRVNSTSQDVAFRALPPFATTRCSRRWSIGDWARAGEKWGDKYEAVIEATGLSYQGVADTKYVSAAFPDFSRRRENLSFKHHREVAALPPERADELLSLAEMNRWSTRRLREEAGAAPAIPSGSGGGSDHTHRAQGTGEKWGDKYEAVIEATGLSYDTINHAKQVSKAFKFSRRRLNLSYTHHVEVASLKPHERRAVVLPERMFCSKISAVTCCRVGVAAVARLPIGVASCQQTTRAAHA